jgi:hypothetical protein
MEILFTALKAALAFFLVMSLWFLWMAYVRRKSGSQSDQDVLVRLTRGCAGCQNSEKCHNRKAQEKQNELTRI